MFVRPRSLSDINHRQTTTTPPPRFNYDSRRWQRSINWSPSQFSSIRCTLFPLPAYLSPSATITLPDKPFSLALLHMQHDVTFCTCIKFIVLLLLFLLLLSRGNAAFAKNSARSRTALPLPMWTYGFAGHVCHQNSCSGRHRYFSNDTMFFFFFFFSVVAGGAAAAAGSSHSPSITTLRLSLYPLFR